MSHIKAFSAGHDELIHDLNYDFYGKRIATCSSDQTIKVFEKIEPSIQQQSHPAPDSIEALQNSPEWELVDSWKAHRTTIVKVAWASPEFGQVIASCSYDGTLKIFEEDPRELKKSGRRWINRATITEFNGPVYDMAFAPSHLGLKIASIDYDGIFRVHEAMDPNNLQNWTLQPPDEKLMTSPASKSRQSAFSLSWCPSMFFKEFIAVAAQNQAYIYYRNGSGPFYRIATFPGHQVLIRSIAWAPSMGRGFQTIAIGYNDGKIEIYKVTKKQKPESTSSATVEKSGGSAIKQQLQQQSVAPAFRQLSEQDQFELSLEKASDLEGHTKEVWKLSWNVTGTILASAGSDGTIRFWKSDYNNKFQCMAEVSAEQREGPTEGMHNS